MSTRDREVPVSQPIDTYEAPELVVHGTVTEVTRGSGGGPPDTLADGSQLPDD